MVLIQTVYTISLWLNTVRSILGKDRGLVTFSDVIKYTTSEFIPTRTAGQLANSLMKVVYGYARGGFVVNFMLMDQEFEKLRMCYR